MNEITIPVTGRDIGRARSALKAVIEDVDGVWISDRGVINLQIEGRGVATITISDEEVWRELAHDLGFQP